MSADERDTFPDDDADIGRLLLRAFRAYNERAVAEIRGLGHSRLSLAHTAIIPHIADGGIRLTTLAQRAGMTKQSASQLVRELEAAGYLEKLPDASDKRAEKIVFTEFGRRFRDDAGRVKRQQEAEITVRLGADGKAMLRDLLSRFPWLTDPSER
jgi:DNA-binding MarR family transcriptional regulator